MCLTTKTSVCSVSEKEIKCYKVLLWDEGIYVTPYQKTFVPKRVIDGYLPFFADGEINIGLDYCEETLSDSYLIGKGFIHTYKYLGSARDFKKHLEKCIQIQLMPFLNVKYQLVQNTMKEKMTFLRHLSLLKK